MMSAGLKVTLTLWRRYGMVIGRKEALPFGDQYGVNAWDTSVIRDSAAL